MTDTDLALIREQLALERTLLEGIIESLDHHLALDSKLPAGRRAYAQGRLDGLEQALYCWARIEALVPEPA